MNNILALAIALFAFPICSHLYQIFKNGWLNYYRRVYHLTFFLLYTAIALLAYYYKSWWPIIIGLIVLFLLWKYYLANIKVVKGSIHEIYKDQALYGREEISDYNVIGFLRANVRSYCRLKKDGLIGKQLFNAIVESRFNADKLELTDEQDVAQRIINDLKRWVNENITNNQNEKDKLRDLIRNIWIKETESMDRNTPKDDEWTKIMKEFEAFYPRIMKFHGLD